MFENQLFAARGYAVLCVNSRGSGGYSEEFADIRKHYGERDFRDLMEAVDYAIKNRKFVDPERLGVTGISYGGFMTNWVVGHTDRFKAAVSVEGISSWFAMYGTTDIGFYFAPDQIGGEPWNNVEGYVEKSPLVYADEVKTPIMFIHSMEDYRCWVDQALSFYTALKAQGKETQLVLFLKGSHTFGWSGKPSHRIKKLEHTLNWFKKYLK
jgi:dipeptidyl aminopeptidase/acylaminoacyl peptidase